MPRPLSWLPRLHDIRRSVAADNRSHYGRKDLEDLFGIQPTAAGQVLRLLPTVAVGTSQLAEREALAGLLDRVQAAEDPAALLEQLRSTPRPRPRRKIQFRTDLPTVTLASLPANLILETGRVEVRFETVEELAQIMFSLAQIMEFETDTFVGRYEPKPPSPPSPGRDDLRAMYEELERLEQARR